MEQQPRNQAEALTFAKKREKELRDRKLFESESECLELLNWAKLPITKRIIKKFRETKEKFHDYFESQKWTNEADARGIAYSLRFLSVLEKLVESTQKSYENIQSKKQKES